MFVFTLTLLLKSAMKYIGWSLMHACCFAPGVFMKFDGSMNCAKYHRISAQNLLPLTNLYLDIDGYFSAEINCFRNTKSIYCNGRPSLCIYSPLKTSEQNQTAALCLHRGVVPYPMCPRNGLI